MVENLSLKQFRGVGAIIVSEDSGRVMTVLRSPQESYPNTWTFAGGKVEADESEINGLRRELQEELQLIKIKKIIPLHRYQSRSKDFVYDTFVVLVNKEFIPELNWENAGYAWTSIDSLPSPLHPKARQMISSSRLIKKFKNFYSWIDKKNVSRDNSIPEKDKTTTI
jgi:8-oxo-dGTP pyrophosphatase MutT (NUDIX family)